MQLTYVFSELRTGLRRNVSMTVAVVVTMFVSLTLVGLGLLLNAQANKAEEFWGDRLQITVFLCNQNSATANCVNGEVTDAQKEQVQQVLRTNSEVASYRPASKQEAYDKWRAAYVSNNDTERRVYSSIRPSAVARPSSAGRPMPSPFQNGTRPGWPKAGLTMTRSCVISSIRQLVAPRAKTSPTRDS